MSVAKFRIPRLTAAILVLGGACSEDTTRPKGTNDDNQGDGGATGDGDADDSQFGTGSDKPGGGSGDGDGDGDTQVGDGDGDIQVGDGDGDTQVGDGDASSAGIDLSASRIAKIARDFCAQYAKCDREAFLDSYDSQAECVTYNKDYFSEYVTYYGDECADAIFDAFDCSNQLSCQEALAGESCAKEGAAYEKVCEASGKAKKKSKGLRIPR